LLPLLKIAQFLRISRIAQASQRTPKASPEENHAAFGILPANVAIMQFPNKTRDKRFTFIFYQLIAAETLPGVLQSVAAEAETHMLE
jgi:hypothetical protein